MTELESNKKNATLRLIRTMV